jgi:predicted ATPase
LVVRIGVVAVELSECDTCAVAELPTGTVTFLFTDLESSTRLWEHHAEQMDAALARHDEILRAAVEAHGGHVVKTTGDGLHAVFGAATDAVSAARDAQLAIAGERWGVGDGLRVRMGLHSGEANARDGDYFGPALNRAARLMAAGHGGQVLVSQATAQLVEDVAVRDLGEHRLRDLERAEHVFQLLIPGLPAEFPPLRSLGHALTNLPVNLTRFIGRGVELERVRRAVAGSRLVTIVGVGGVGKTRLAVQIAGEVVTDYADGVWISELAPALDTDSMMSAIAASLSVHVPVGAPLEQAIIESLRYRRLLWVLDNCEHVLTPCARLVDEVLQNAPGVRILATTREALDVAGEAIVPLRSMTVADSAELATIQEADAVQLFVDRAQAARPGFELDNATAAIVNDICVRLDGIPLAIELAAARVVAMGVGEINTLLDERFQLLTGGRRIALERHQTLRAAVDWSYSLLTPKEQLVFDRISVCAGSFDRSAAQRVAAGDDVDTWAVVDALEGLVRKVMIDAEVVRGGAARFTVLETLRRYGADRLAERGDAERRRRAHAEYYAEIAEIIGEGLLGRDELTWRERLVVEADNIRAAITWALDQEEVAVLTRLVVALAEETLSNGVLLGNFATRAVGLEDRFDPSSRAVLLGIAALERYSAGDLDQARRYTMQAWAIDMEPSHGATPDLALRVHSIPAFHTLTGRYDAIQLVEDDWDRYVDALAGVRAVYRSRIILGYATIAVQGGRQELAERCAALGYDWAVESENPTTICQALYQTGAVHAASDPEAAWRAWSECIALGRQGAGSGSFGAALFQSALLPAQRGDFPVAFALLDEAVRTLRPRGRTPELDGVFGYAIEILGLAEEHEHAAVVIGAATNGAVQNLREMRLPPERHPADVRAIRDAIGREQFAECAARGASMNYDELTSWLLDTCQTLGGGATHRDLP